MLKFECRGKFLDHFSLIINDFPMQWFLSVLTENPAIRAMQIGLLGAALLSVYLVFFVTRDILLRTRVFWYQVSCIMLSALLPFFGFFLYLLIRPASTVRQREMEAMVKKLLKGHKASTVTP
jgi:hypothetical protein